MAFSSTIREYLAKTTALDLTPFFYATEEGSPYVFTQPGKTVLPADFRPTGFTTATVKDLLKVGHGLDMIREEASRRAGVAQTTEITLALGPDSADFLLEFFAEQPVDIPFSRLAATLDWTDVTIYLDDVTDFPASGVVNIGKEAILYAAKSAPANTLTGCTRGAYGTVCNRYDPDDNVYKNPVIVRDRIVNHEGKVWHLYMGMQTQAGEIVEAIRPQEIFAGICSSNPEAQDWVTWSFRLRDYTALLDTELGGFEVKGEIINSGWFSHLPSDVINSSKWGWVVKGVNDVVKIDITAKLLITVAGPPITLDYEDIDISISEVLTPGFYPNLAVAITNTVNTQLALESFTYVTGMRITFDQGDKDINSPLENEDIRYTLKVMAFASGADDFTKDTTSSHINISLHAEELNCALHSLGFSNEESTFKGVIALAQTTVEYAAPDLPIVFEYNSHCDLLPVRIFKDEFAQVEQTIATTGYLVINETEVVKYSSYVEGTSDVPFEGVYLFTISEHAALGSDLTEYRLRWATDGENETTLKASEESNPEVKVLWGIESDSVFDALLKLMISTGGNRYPAGDYAVFDSDDLPEYFSTPIPGPYLDIAAFAKASAGFPGDLIQRSLAFSSPQKLRDLVESQLVIMGYCLFCKPLSDGTYKLSLADTANIVTQTTLELVPDGLGGYSVAQGVLANTLTVVGDKSDNRPTVKHDLNSLINRAICKPLYDVAKETQLDWTWTYTEEDSRLEYGVLRSIEFAPKGLGNDPEVGRDVCNALIAGLVIRWSRRQQIWEFPTDFRGWLYSPGDQVALTVPGIPNGYGTRGITDRVMTIIAVEKAYFAPRGDYPCKITAISTIDGNFSMYAPGAQVTAKGDDGTDYLTLAANAYSVDDDPSNVFGVPEDDFADVLFFLGAGSVTLWRKGDYENRETLEVDSVDVANNRIYVTSVPATDCSQGDAVLTYGDWDDADLTDSQREWCYIGDLVDDEAVTGDPFKWQ